MKRVSNVLIFILLFALVSGQSLAARDIYVKPGADGKGDAPGDAYGELWKALEKAVRGDIIHVAQGVQNGKGGSGHFVVKVPNITLAGGYKDDFSERNPFKYFTVLERARDFKGDWTGLPEAIIAGDQHADHSGLIVDGFVLNAESRNRYTDNVVSLKAPSYPGMLFQTSSPNVKIRNCILLNPVGDGIYCTWQGKENEVVNNFILNTFYAAVETRSAQPNSVILVKNNTIAFGWSYPSKGGHIGLFVGRQGKTIIENNVFAFLQTEADEDGLGVKNTFGNEDTVMKNNVFFSCVGGFYKYMDSNKQSLVIWKAKDLKDVNDSAEDYALSEAEGNREADPGLKPDRDFATKFANFISSTPGKLNMDAMNKWRQAVGLPLQADPGSARKNYGFAYPLGAVVPNLVSSIAGTGARPEVVFASYKAGASVVEKQDYEEVELASFKKGGANAKGMGGKAIALKAGVGETKQIYEIEQAGKTDYVCVQLLKPGVSGPTTMDFMYGYIQKGSPAHKAWTDQYKRKDRTYKEGITIKGRAFDFKNQNYSYPVGIVIDEVGKK